MGNKTEIQSKTCFCFFRVENEPVSVFGFGPSDKRTWPWRNAQGEKARCAQAGRGMKRNSPCQASAESISEHRRSFETIQRQTMAVQRRCSYHGHLPPPLHRRRKVVDPVSQNPKKPFSARVNLSVALRGLVAEPNVTWANWGQRDIINGK